MGFRHSAIAWFDSYLYNRIQVTKHNSTLSDPLANECGVPQGSILGHLVFICYINDLPKHLTQTTASIYADDTALLAFVNNIQTSENKLQHDVSILCKWFDTNKLCMNSCKTKTMLFTSNHSNLKDQQLNITVNDEVLNSVSSFKYLGVELDRYLNFEQHMNKICSKVNERTGLLWRIRSFINTSLASELYTSLIEPYFLYSDFVYNGC